MAIELVALDLDGTLLDSQGKLSERNAAAIAAAQAQGVKVILATGKTYWSAVGVMATLNLALPGVFSQGMIVREADGTIMREIILDFDLVEDLLSYIERERLPLIAYNRQGLLTPQNDDYNANIYGKYGEPPPYFVGRMVGRARELELNKLLIGDTGDIAARRIDLEQRVGHQATVIQAITEYVEIMPKGVSKGAGLLWLLERMEVEAGAVLAMGDGENDIEMLQLAGIGVTMSNARPLVQAAADYIVGSNDESAVAQALERFVLR